jgi:hypothetical protein
VLAADAVTGERGPREVTDLIRHGGPHTMVAVQLAGAGQIDATDKHPFWVASQRKWVDAIDLKPGDVVLSDRGDQIKVTNLKTSQQDLPAYNLTVAGMHTYYALAGQTPVLVHNNDCVPEVRTLPSRSSVFGAAKRDLGIPNGQQPDEVNIVPMTNGKGETS